MSMAWVRLDTGWPRNAKTLAVLSRKGGDRALIVWLSGLCWAGEQGTDGWIPEAALPFLHGTQAAARMLVEAGLWDRNGTGWHVHDWSDYQPTTAEAVARSTRAKWLSCKRWHAPECTCSPPPDPAAPGTEWRPGDA